MAMFPLNPDLSRLLIDERIADEHRAADHYRRMAEARRARRPRRKPAILAVPRPRAARTVNGTEVRIVEARASYRRAMFAFLRELSAHTAYNRFLTRGAPAEVVDVDVMLARDACHRAVLAVRGDEIVGHAQAIAWPDRTVVELAVVVADEWQGRGIGRRLVDALLESGPAASAAELTLFVLVWNTRARRMVKSRWPDAAVERDGELLHYRIHTDRAAEQGLLVGAGCRG
jgi:acetyltransferase